jgi:hypothetical protein
MRKGRQIVTISQTSTNSQRSAAAVRLDPLSVLGFIYEERAFFTPGANGRYVYGTYQLSPDGEMATAITLVEEALDIGNSGAATAVMHALDHRLSFTKTEATYEPLPAVLYGEQMETWRERYYDDAQRGSYESQLQRQQIDSLPEQYSETFSVGQHASSRKGLPIGATDVRLADQRYVRYLRVCLVRGLKAAGYAPGRYYIGLAIGVRNEEVNAQMGVDPHVQEALSTLTQPFTLVRNGTEVWTIEVRESYPLPQSFGTHFALDRGIFGQVLQPTMTNWTILDLGYNDAHVLEVIRPEKGALRVTGQKVLAGVVDVARGLVGELRKSENFPFVPSDLSDAEAIELLHSEVVMIGGVPLQDPEEAKRATLVIRGYKDREGGSLVGAMAARHTRLDSTFVFTGGGSSEFSRQIVSQMKVMQRPEHLYRLLPPEIARFANVAGLYWMLNIRKRPSTVLR